MGTRGPSGAGSQVESLGAPDGLPVPPVPPFRRGATKPHRGVAAALALPAAADQAMADPDARCLPDATPHRRAAPEPAPKRRGADAGASYYSAISPCVVKNSFLHFTDGEEQPASLLRRGRSEPCLSVYWIDDAPLAEPLAGGSASPPPKAQAELPVSTEPDGRRAEWGDDVVTVMIRQLPRQYTQMMFLEELNNRGFEGLFDFMYFPFDSKKDYNVGYGFVNFTKMEYAERFRNEFDGAYLDPSLGNRGKPLRIHPAAMQGYEANYYHFGKAKAGHKQDMKYGPLFLHQGSNVAAPDGEGRDTWSGLEDWQSAREISEQTRCVAAALDGPSTPGPPRGSYRRRCPGAQRAGAAEEW